MSEVLLGKDVREEKTSGWLDKSRDLLVAASEIVSGLLMLSICIFLLASITSRYVLHYPLTWIDDLVALNFIWLTIFGSIVAYHRSQHMAMTLIVGLAKPRTRKILEMAANLGEIVVFGALIHPGIVHAEDGAIIGSPALDISMFYQGAAIPVGCAALTFMAFVKFVGTPKRDVLLPALLVVAAFGAIAFVGGAITPQIGKLNLVVFFVVILGGSILSGFPIAAAFLLSTYSYMGLASLSPVSVVAARMEAGLTSILMLSIPGFILLGSLMGITGMAKALVGFLGLLVGNLRGGLNYVMIIAMFLMSGISGSKAADMAAVAPSLLPEMRKRGHRPGDAVALLTATGIQSETIPPSIVLIAIGSVTTVSIQALFAGGLLPAIVMAIILCIVVFFRSRGDHHVPQARPSLTEILKLLVTSSPAIALPFIIRSAVVEGIATATEVATIGVAYAVMLGVLVNYKELPAFLRRFWIACVDSASLTASILLVLAGVTGMSFALAQSGFSQQVAQLALSVPGGAAGFMAISIVLFIVLGAALEGLPAMVLFAPLLFPAAAPLGIDPVHYAVVTVFAMGIGLFTPPFGVGYFIACAVSNVDPKEGMRPFMVYLAALLVGLVVIAALPITTTRIL